MYFQCPHVSTNTRARAHTYTHTFTSILTEDPVRLHGTSTVVLSKSFVYTCPPLPFVCQTLPSPPHTWLPTLTTRLSPWFVWWVLPEIVMDVTSVSSSRSIVIQLVASLSEWKQFSTEFLLCNGSKPSTALSAL